MEEKTIGKPALQERLIFDYKIPQEVAIELMNKCPNLTANSRIITGIVGDTLKTYDGIDLPLIQLSNEFAFAYETARDILYIKNL